MKNSEAQQSAISTRDSENNEDKMPLVCYECTMQFYYNPVKMSIVLISIALAILTFIFLLRKSLTLNQKLALMYGHIFFLVFPFVFYSLFKGCQAIFSACSQLKSIILLVIITAAIAMMIGLLTAPILFIRSYKKRAINLNIKWIENFTSIYSKILAIRQPKMFIVDIAKPLAFSVSMLNPKIFISVGMLELLSRKETAAVLLHEMFHIKNRTPLFKFSSFFARVISPLARFTSFSDVLDNEEKNADSYAVEMQKTSRHILSAKKKIDNYNETK